MYTVLKSCFTILLSLTIFSKLYSQADYFHKQLLPGSSASANNISDILIDDGRIWIASYDGLQEYDGYTFTSYEDSTYADIPKKLLSIVKDKNGMLWCSDFFMSDRLFSNTPLQGKKLISIYDPSEQRVIKFENYIDTTLLPNYPSNLIDAYPDNDGNIWIMNRSGDYLKYTTKLQTTDFKHLNRHERVFPIGSKYYLLKTDSIIEYGSNLKVLSKIFAKGYNIKIESGPESNLFLTSSERIHSPNQVILRKITNGEVIDLPYKLEKTEYLNHDFKFAVSSFKNETYISDISSGTTTQIAHKLDGFFRNPKILDSDHIFFPSSTGIHHFSSTIFPFEIIKDKPNESNRHMTYINDSLLLYSSYLGAKIQNLQTKEISDYSKDYFFGLTELPDNKLLLGDLVNDYLHLDILPDGKINTTKLSDTHREYMQHRVFFYDKSRKRIWLGSDRNLRKVVKMDFARNSLESAPTTYNLYDIKCFFLKGDTLSVGTTYGLFEIYGDESIEQLEGVDSYIYDIKRKEDGTYILASQDKGVIIITPDGERTEINESLGLSNQTVYSLELDDRNYIWAGTQNGLTMIKPDTYETFSFHKNHGISNDEFNYTSTYKDDKGKLYFGSVDGIISFYPDQIRDKLDSELTDINLLEVKSWDPDIQDFTFTKYTEGDELEVAAKSRSLKLKLSLDNISYLQDNLFQYKIPDLLDDWKIIPKNSVVLTNLPVGEHELMIRTKSSISKPITIPLYVKQHYYYSWWFILLAILLPLLALRYYLQKKNESNIKRRKALEEEVHARTVEIVNKTHELELSNKSKDQIISILAHDLRSPLLSLHGVSSKISYLIEQDRTENLKDLGKDIHKKTHRIQRLVDNMLHWAIIQSGGKNSVFNTFNIDGPVTQAIDLYEDIARAKNISIEYENDSNIVLYSDLNIFQTVIRNLLDNAIKYSPMNSMIKINCTIKEDTAIISIIDQGEGIEEDKLNILNTSDLNDPKMMGASDGTGLGLSICKHLLKEHDQDLWYSANKPSGAIFSFSQQLSEEE